MLQALLRHAVKIRHKGSAACTLFNRRYSALRGLFPRGPQRWNQVLSEARYRFLEHTQGRMAEDLADILGMDNQRPSRTSRGGEKEPLAPIKEYLVRLDRPAMFSQSSSAIGETPGVYEASYNRLLFSVRRLFRRFILFAICPLLAIFGLSVSAAKDPEQRVTSARRKEYRKSSMPFLYSGQGSDHSPFVTVGYSIAIIGTTDSRCIPSAEDFVTTVPAIGAQLRPSVGNRCKPLLRPRVGRRR